MRDLNICSSMRWKCNKLDYAILAERAQWKVACTTLIFRYPEGELQDIFS